VTIVAAGTVAILALAGFVLMHRSLASGPVGSPTWGVFTDAQWQTLATRVGVPASALQMVTAMPARNGTPFAIVNARRCFYVVRGLSPGPPICELSAPVMAFTTRDSQFVDVVGLAGRRVASLVSTWRLPDGRTTTSGSALLSAPGAWGFGSGYSGTLVTLTARDAHNRVIARVYCASALRGVCGMSAQRRS
jgi:hypothetical protein